MKGKDPDANKGYEAQFGVRSLNILSQTWSPTIYLANQRIDKISSCFRLTLTHRALGQSPSRTKRGNRSPWGILVLGTCVKVTEMAWCWGQWSLVTFRNLRLMETHRLILGSGNKELFRIYVLILHWKNTKDLFKLRTFCSVLSCSSGDYSGTELLNCALLTFLAK